MRNKNHSSHQAHASKIRSLLASPEPPNSNSVECLCEEVAATLQGNGSRDLQDLYQRKLDSSSILLEVSSVMLREKILKREDFDILQELLLSTISRSLKTDSSPESQRTFDLHIENVTFTQTVSFKSIVFNELSFSNCDFSGWVDFSWSSSRTPVSFKQCRFYEETSPLIRLSDFPKPPNPSDWQPSFMFDDCQIESMLLMDSDVFLFFRGCVINYACFPLKALCSLQFVECTLGNVITHSVTEDTLGDELVPANWFVEDRGWIIGPPSDWVNDDSEG